MSDSNNEQNVENDKEESKSIENNGFNKDSLAESLGLDQTFQKPELVLNVLDSFSSGHNEWQNAYLNVCKQKEANNEKKENITMRDLVQEIKKQGYDKAKQEAAEQLEDYKKFINEDAQKKAKLVLDSEKKNLALLKEENERLKAELAKKEGITVCDLVQESNKQGYDKAKQEEESDREIEDMEKTFDNLFERVKLLEAELAKKNN